MLHRSFQLFSSLLLCFLVGGNFMLHAKGAVADPDRLSDGLSAPEPAAQNCENICSCIHKKDINIEDYMLTGISDDQYLILMNPHNGDTREDLKRPEGELGNQLVAEFGNGRELICTVVKVCGKEWVIASRTNTAFDIKN